MPLRINESLKKKEKFRLAGIRTVASAIQEIKSVKKFNTKITEMAKTIKHCTRCNSKC